MIPYLDQILRVAELFIVAGGITLVWRFGRAVQKFESQTEQHAEDIQALKDNTSKIAEALQTLVRHDERLTGLGSRVGRLEGQLDDLRHGEGFVMPGMRLK